MIDRPADRRRSDLRRLQEEHFDVLVIGGGINGAAIAREAALRGLRTALVDKGDFASGTSSRSSKLIHGGFRYLETGDFWLVLEASRERDLLRRRLAPHLVRPLRFFFPVYRGGPLRPWKLRAGLLLYDLLAAFRNIERHQMVRASAALLAEPKLRAEGLRGGALYYDCFTDDARLVLENVLAARSAGATCANYLSVESLRKHDGRVAGAEVRDLDAEGGRFGVRARAVINAAGPWLDRVRALDDPKAEPVLRPTKGVHILLPRDRVGNQNAVALHTVRDRRILFVIPWEDHTLVGTTDTDYDGSPDEVCAEPEDLAYLLEAVNFYFPAARVREPDVVSSYAGLRPLIASGPLREAPSAVSREDAMFESAAGLVSLGGGKLTTYRRVAIKVVDRVAAVLRDRFGIDARRSSRTARLPLPGAVGGAAEALPTDADEFASMLQTRYGTRAAEVMALLRTDPTLGTPVASGVRDVRAQTRFAAQAEMALRVEDVLRRRTTVALRSTDGGASAAESTAALMAEALDWDSEKRQQRAGEYAADAAAPDRRWRRHA